MIPVQIILIALVTLVTDAHECNCTCDRLDMNICDEQEVLRSGLANLSKWDRYYNFVRSLAKDWQSQVAYVVRQQLEVSSLSPSLMEYYEQVRSNFTRFFSLTLFRLETVMNVISRPRRTLISCAA
jgi:hypothetical protein